MGDRLDRGDSARVPAGADRPAGSRLIEGRFQSYEEKVAWMLAGRERPPVTEQSEGDIEAERLPGAERAVIDPRKLSAYSMRADHPDNRNKARAWADLGYEVETEEGRDLAAAEVADHVRELIGASSAREVSPTKYGRRYQVRIPLVGSNGVEATLLTGWQVDHDGDGAPKMTTIWAEIHRGDR